MAMTVIRFSIINKRQISSFKIIKFFLMKLLQITFMTLQNFQNYNFKTLSFETFKETVDATHKRHAPLIKKYV